MKVSAATRSRARHFAMQAIYQWRMTGNDLISIEAEFHTDNNMEKVDTDYFHQALHGVAKIKSNLETLFSPHLKSVEMAELDPVTHAILLLACFEFQERVDVPYKVVINEAVNLAKKFGAEDSHKFVNGVLDKVAVQVRQVEVSASKKKGSR